MEGYRASTGNLRTQFERIVRRAGLTPWPRLFNAMRASRATELAAEYPSAVCSAWMGHSAAIAEAHYHMVRESDFERATGMATEGGAERGAHGAQIAAQHASVPKGTGQNERSQPIDSGGLVPPGAPLGAPGQTSRMSATGLEPVTSAM